MTTYRCTDGPSTRTIEYLVGDQYPAGVDPGHRRRGRHHRLPRRRGLNSDEGGTVGTRLPPAAGRERAERVAFDPPEPVHRRPLP